MDDPGAAGADADGVRERELGLITVHAPAERRGELKALADVFDARVTDVGPEAMMFEVVGSADEIEAFQELVRPHGIKELVRTGRIGLARASAREQRRRLSAIN
ncbi:MAG TPA: acetolactate synthase small subunit [Gaiellaceae bacterium]|nr:acetolactate synthase small subunit [Gaiellaceae bacterium]